MGDLSVNNLFNEITQSGLYASIGYESTQTGSFAFVPTYPYVDLWGTTDFNRGNYFRGYRTMGVSLGLKF
jgi:hypothetical protein